MDNLYCYGNERSLSECRFDGWKVHDCTSQEAAGVICRSRFNRTDVRAARQQLIRNISRIILNMTDLISARRTPPTTASATFTSVLSARSISEVQIVGGRASNEGRVEIRLKGSLKWNVLCGHGWSLLEATVVCRQQGMGYGQFAAVGSFASSRPTAVLPSIHCKGHEKGLSECRFNASHSSCSGEESSHIAGVVCSRGIGFVI